MISRYTISSLIKDVNRKLHGAGISMTDDFFGAVDEARREMLGKIQPPELKRTAFIEQALYDHVDRYAVPSDLQYDNVDDIQLVSSRHNLDTMYAPLEQVYQKRFQQKRKGARNIFSINYDNGVKYMSIAHPRGIEKDYRHQLLNSCDSLTENGTWNIGGNVVNLQIDKVNHVTKTGALRFDFNDSSTDGYIENSTMDSVDLSDYMQVGANFVWLNISQLNVLSTVTLRFGSSVSDYYEFTVNQPHDGNEFLVDWNLLRFPLDGLTQVGFPNLKEVTYLRIDFTTNGAAMSNCRLDSVVARSGKLYRVTYNSVFIIVDPVGQVWKQKATKASDIIVAEEDTYQLFMLQTTYAMMQETYDNSNKSMDDINKIKSELIEKYAIYLDKHKEEAVDHKETLYVFGEMYSGLTDTPMNNADCEEGMNDYSEETNSRD